MRWFELVPATVISIAGLFGVVWAIHAFINSGDFKHWIRLRAIKKSKQNPPCASCTNYSDRKCSKYVDQIDGVPLLAELVRMDKDRCDFGDNHDLSLAYLERKEKELWP